MKVLFIFVLSFASMILLISTASAHSTMQDDPYRVEEFTVSGPGNLEVRTSGGHITVKASESSRVRVEMYVRKNGRELSASDYDLNDFEIDISQSGNTVRAHAMRENGNNWSSGTTIISPYPL